MKHNISLILIHIHVNRHCIYSSVKIAPIGGESISNTLSTSSCTRPNKNRACISVCVLKYWIICDDCLQNYHKLSENHTHTNTLIQLSTCTQIPSRPCRNHKIFTIHASKPIMVLMCLFESRKRERGISERRNCLQMCDSRTKEKIKNTVFINQNKTNNKLCYWCV